MIHRILPIFEPRNQESEPDPASEPRIQRKCSVHFDTGSPNKQTNLSSLPNSNTTSSVKPHQSPPTSVWNMDHPAVNHEASSPLSMRMREEQVDAGDEDRMDGRMDGEEEEIHHPDGKVSID